MPNYTECNSVRACIEKRWYQTNILSKLLWPLSFLYRAVVTVRQKLYQVGLKKITHFSVPVIVVGNITVGGVGKSPLVAYLAKTLTSMGLQPGIVSRGYGGKATHWPQIVTEFSDPLMVGDEPVMLVNQTHCPMVVGPDRVAAVKKLLDRFPCNVVLSDDGLQHYAMGRDIEIAVLDGRRRFGNGYCLPAGPLREPIKRLNKVDFVVSNEQALETEILLQLKPKYFYALLQPETQLPLNYFQKPVHAVAGIGHPQRFFDTLKQLNIVFTPHVFPDHHQFTSEDLQFDDDQPVLMTEKDAVKCREFAMPHFFALAIEAEISETFINALHSKTVLKMV